LYTILTGSNTAAAPHNAVSQLRAATEHCVAKITINENHPNFFAISMEFTNKYLVTKIRGFTLWATRAHACTQAQRSMYAHTRTHTHKQTIASA
jgi:hypothetical protein